MSRSSKSSHIQLKDIPVIQQRQSIKQGPKPVVWQRCSSEISKHQGSKSSVMSRNIAEIKVTDDEECIEVYVLSPTFMASLWLKFPYVFKIGEHRGSSSSLLHEVCLERGWKDYDRLIENYSTDRDVPIGWNLWWSHLNHSPRTLKTLSSWQLTNRTHRNFGFTSKDTCTRYIRRLRQIYGDIYDLCPLSFNVPSEYAKLCIEHTERKSKVSWNFWDRAHYIGNPVRRPLVDVEKQPIWICKPVGKSQGKGIMVFDTVANLTYTTRSVVQEYITRPHLIGDYKWDLRIYVCVVSISPLVFYAYREGLVRFATNPFDLKNLSNSFAHLTNSSLNKSSPTYFKNKIGVGRGCKWRLRKLRSYFEDKGIRDWFLWQRIYAILVLTIIGDASAISATFNQACRAKTFFLMGFDIMVDRDLKPVLVEVNSNPSLSNDCEVDRLVKKPMLHDLFDLLNLPDGRDFESYIDSNPLILKNYPTHPISSRNSQPDTPSESEPEESLESYNSNSGFGQESSTKSNDVRLSRDSGDNFDSSTTSFHTSLGKEFQSVLYKSGPITGFKELIKLTIGNDELEAGTLGSITGNEILNISSRSRSMMSKYARMEYPVFVSIHIRRMNSRRRTLSHVSSWRTGLTLEAPNWQTDAPIKIGNWIRIFPFNKETEKLSTMEKSIDQKDSIRQVQEFLKMAEQLSKAQFINDASLDQILKSKLKLTTQPWHPMPSLGKIPRF